MLSHLPGAMFEELIISILRNGSRGELATKHSTVALKHRQVPWGARSRHPWLAEAGPVCQYWVCLQFNVEPVRAITGPDCTGAGWLNAYYSSSWCHGSGLILLLSAGTNVRAYMDCPVRDRSVSIANALETPQSRTKPSVRRYAHAHVHVCTQSQGHAHWRVCSNLWQVNLTDITNIHLSCTNPSILNQAFFFQKKMNPVLKTLSEMNSYHA